MPAATAIVDLGRRALLDAYIDLIRTSRRLPSIALITRQANCSIRLVYARFRNLEQLGVEALDEVLSRRMIKVPATAATGDRAARIGAQVAAWSATCEYWLPLWELVARQEDEWPELAERGELRREETRQKLAAYYAPELQGVSEEARRSLLFVLDLTTDLRVWGTMRERDGLGAADATEIWMEVTRRLLSGHPI